jgi:hypothetical protein
VHIDSAGENAFVLTAFGSSSSPFIGPTDQPTEGVYVWDGGRPSLASEARRGPGEPNDSSDEDLVHLGGDGLWNDIANNQYRGIVQLAQTSSTVPQPMTVTSMGTGLLGIMGAGHRRRRRAGVAARAGKRGGPSRRRAPLSVPPAAKLIPRTRMPRPPSPRDLG